MKQQAEEEDGPSQTVVSNKVLILQQTVFNGTSSQEAVAARNLGMTVEVVTTAQWAAKTAAEFATYRAIILGDAKCVAGSAINSAVANRNVWGPMVNGNIIVVGTTPVLNSGTSSVPGPMTKDAIAFAVAQPDKTGLYVSLSCYYASAPTPANPPGTPVPVLDQFGTFTVLSPTGCYNTAHITGTFLTTPSITDTNLSNWGCSAKEVFDVYPTADFTPLVIAKDNATGSPFPGSKTMPDATHGPVYVLAKGASPLNCGNSVVNATEECDNGAQNGAPGNACSSACRLHWCGDGIVDPTTEQCDLGAGNGNTGTCSASCMTISTNRPPVARCKPAQSFPTPTNSCGVSLPIDNGSFDPDDNLLSCTQSPAGPYGLGSTTVTLTCRDTGGLTNTCTTVVSVYDNVAPRMTCPGDITAECTNGIGHVTLPAPSSANDNCSAVTVSGPGDGDFALGTTEVQYTARDVAGNTSMCTDGAGTEQPIRVTVRDTLGPVVMPNGFGRVQLECGTDSYSELGATANDQCYGDATSTITISGAVDPGKRGSYMITYSATDPNGNVGEGYRDVVVEDLTPPVLALTGANPQPLECGIEPYTELGATARDNCSGDLTPYLRVDSRAVNPNAVDRYPVKYVISDAREWEAEATRTVAVNDNTPPVITCPAPTAAECVWMGIPGRPGGAVVDPGPASATDACALASISPNSPRSYPHGTTTVGYTATDVAGHTATCSTQVTVFDSLPPSVELVGTAAPVLECGVDPYIESGATAVDVCYGDISSRIVREGDVNPHAEGFYDLKYSATDPDDNSSVVVHREVRVKDTRSPSIHLEGANPMRLECGVDRYSEPSRAATDACYGDLSSLIHIDNPVNTSIEGPYTVSYSITDPAGNSANETRSVSVEDALPPSITLSGASTQSLECGIDRYTELGATAQDACSGNLTSSIRINASAVDPHLVGTYSVSYDVEDGHGWPAHTERKVQVADKTPPAISCPAPTVAECVGGGAVVDPGPASATDACALASISPHVPATYPLGTTNVPYTATDRAGHSATCSTAVIVADTTPPQLTLQGDPAPRLRCGAPYVEAGATAADACSGDLTGQIVKSGTVDTSNPGHYAINYSVADSAGLTASATRTVEVYREPPQIVTRAPTVLPRSHVMASLQLSDCATIVTSCGSPIDINQQGRIVSIYTDEPDDSRGDGHTVHDVVITGPSSFQLRGERAGRGSGRAYGVSFTVIDPSGANLGSGFCKFVVPHDNSRQPVIDDGPLAGYIVQAP